MNRTILYYEHLALNAKMVDFAGWEMPVQYTGIKDETKAVREAQGMFDVSHMGEIRVSGIGAGEFLDYVLSRKISHKNPELTNYAFLCYEDGGVVDDLMVYQLGTDDYWLVVNAVNTDKDFAHLQEMLAKYGQQNEISISNETAIYGLIAIQGAGSLTPTLNALIPIYPNLNISKRVEDLKRFRRVSFPLNDKRLVVSRTGYTGEDGYEVYLPVADTIKLWQNLLKENVKPCGLGARDALRLEAGLPLYGHELSSEINPLEAGLAKFVELDRDFVGKAMVNKQQRKLIALISEDKSIPRDGYKVFVQDQEIGYITSGSYSPTLNKGIAFALVTAVLVNDITEVEVAIRRKKHIYKITTTPFV